MIFFYKRDKMSLNRESIFKELEKAFTGDPSKRHSTIREYWQLSPEEGINKAREYLRNTKVGQDASSSDSIWWAYEGDITLASCLISIFSHLRRGYKIFPPIAKADEKVLMNKQADLLIWSKNLVSDHIHEYDANCIHKAQSIGNQSKCKIGKIDYAGLYHTICSVCGDDQFGNPFYDLIEK